MKKVLLLLLLLFSLGYSNWCYQESFNTSNQSGTDTCAGLNYSGSAQNSLIVVLKNVVDGSWTTYSGGVSETVNMTYYKPTKNNLTGAILQTKWGLTASPTTNNYTIVSSCWDLNESYIKFGYEMTGSASCPFVYSWNGTEYILDSEAITRHTVPEWEGSQLSRMPSLLNDNGKVKLKITEELFETSYINKVQLVKVTHKKGSEAYSGLETNIYSINNTQFPTSSIDKNGKEITSIKDDGIFWGGNYEGLNLYDLDGDNIADSNETEDLSTWLDLTFDKPENQTTVKLHMGIMETTQEGLVWTNALGQLNLTERSELVTNGTFLNWFVNLATFRIYIWNGTDWEFRGIAQEFAQHYKTDVVYEMDISNIQTEDLKFRFETSSMGLLDYAYVDYSDDNIINIETFESEDEVLEYIDELRYELEIGDHIDIEFNNVTDEDKDYDTTYFLNVSGYYVAHSNYNLDLTREELYKQFDSKFDTVKISIFRSMQNVNLNKGIPAGTQITLWNDTKINVENLYEGIEIKYYDPLDEQLKKGEVIGGVAQETTLKFVEINKELNVSYDDLIYANEKWTRARNLKVGDILTGEEECRLITELNYYDVNDTGYVFTTTKGFFFANDVLIHNAFTLTLYCYNSSGRHSLGSKGGSSTTGASLYEEGVYWVFPGVNFTVDVISAPAYLPVNQTAQFIFNVTCVDYGTGACSEIANNVSLYSIGGRMANRNYTTDLIYFTNFTTNTSWVVNTSADWKINTTKRTIETSHNYLNNKVAATNWVMSPNISCAGYSNISYNYTSNTSFEKNYDYFQTYVHNGSTLTLRENLTGQTIGNVTRTILAPTLNDSSLTSIRFSYSSDNSAVYTGSTIYNLGVRGFKNLTYYINETNDGFIYSNPMNSTNRTKFNITNDILIAELTAVTQPGIVFNFNTTYPYKASSGFIFWFHNGTSWISKTYNVGNLTALVNFSATINSPQNISYGTNTILLNATNSTPVNATWYNWNGTNVSYTTSVNITFANGSNTIIVYTNHSSGLLEQSSRTFYVDVEGPEIEIIHPENDTYANTTQLLNISFDYMDVDKVWYNWNGTNVTYTNELEIKFGMGTHTLTAWANDSLGNVNSTNVTFTITGFTQAEITIESPEEIFYNTTEILLNITNQTEVGAIWYNWNGTNYSYTEEINITFNEGENVLHAWANNTAGEENYTNATFTVDTIFPTIEIIHPTNTTYTNATQLLNISVNDTNIEDTWYNWNGTNYTYTEELNITFEEGGNTINVWANDSAGNVNTTEISFTIDTTPPLIEIISPEEKIYNTSIILINITNSSADLDTIWYNWNGTNTTYLEEVNTTFPDGNYTLEVWGNDTYGNVNYTNVSFSVDTTFPTIEIINPLNQTYNYTSILLNISSDDINIDSTWYDWNGTNTSYTEAGNITFIEGDIHLVAYVNDTAGNLNSSEVYFSIDVTIPTITINTPENLIYDKATQSLNITAEDTHIDTIWYNWNGTNTSYTEVINITFNEGENTLHAWVNDTYGNSNYTNVTFTIDTIYPELEILNPLNTTYNYTSILLHINATDINLDSVWYNWEGSNESYAAEFNITFNEGENTIHAWANDTAGNVNYTNVTFFIDSIAPNITVYSPIENKVYTEDVVLINITASDLHLEDIWYNWNGTNYTYTEAFNITMSEGNYTLNIWANDSYGNVGSETVDFSYFIPNLFANFTGLPYGIYYFNATVTNGTHNFSTDTYVVNLSYLDWGTLNYPVNESEDVQIQEVNFTLNDIFYTDIDGNIMPVNITIYLNDSLIYNETLNETQDIILNYSTLNYSENTWYNLTVNYSDIITNDSKYYLYKTSHLYGEINLTENTDEGIYVNKYYVDAEAEILNNFTTIENVTIYLWNASDDTLLNQTSGNDTTFNANFTGFNSVGFFELLINATAVDIDSNELYVLNSKYLNITNNIPSCSAVNYTLNYSEGIYEVDFILETWKQYGVKATNQTDDIGLFNLSCDTDCDVYMNFDTNITGIILKVSNNNSYYYSQTLENSSIYTEYFSNLSDQNYIWVWGDFNVPDGSEYLNITVEVCGVE